MIPAYISETLLFLCYSLLMGTLLLRIVPASRQPDVRVPAPLLPLLAAGIGVLSFIPVLRITWFYAEALESGFWTILPEVLTKVNVGQGWLWTLVLCASLMLMLSMKGFKRDRVTNYIALLILLALIGLFGWSSHTSALYGWTGFLAETIHFLAVVVWLGVLHTIAWFTRNYSNWNAFLNWFSPLSVLSAAATIAAGFALMQMVAPQYFDAWIVPYGQALLIKHLLIIPLFVFAFINGFLMKRGAMSRSPQGWLRAESVFAALILAATGYMGQQSPPHNVSEFLKEEKASALFDFFYTGTITPGLHVELELNAASLGFAALALLALWRIILLFQRHAAYWKAVLVGILFVASGYLSLMFAAAS